MESFKERMRRARLRAGFRSQGDAAKAIGCERGTVSMWEAPSSATESVSGEYLLAAARAYQVRPEWLNEGGEDGYPWTGRVHEARASVTVPSAKAASLGLVHQPSQPVRREDETMDQALVLLQLIAAARPTDKRFRTITWGMVQAAAKAVRATETEADAVTKILGELQGG